jgi:hypothetical protein
MIVRAALGALALVAAGAVVPVRAEPAYGSVTGVDGVLYDDCREHPYAYAVAPPAEAEDWDLQVQAYGPDGQLSDTDFVHDGVLAGNGSFLLCPPADLYGRFTIRATLDWYDGSTWHPIALADASFSMRKPATRTGLSVSTRRPAYGTKVAYRFRVRDERPEGFAPTAFAWVVLQKRAHGRWVRVKDSRTLTHADGRVKLRLEYRRHRKPLRVRAVTQEGDRWAASVSAPVRLW